MRCVVTGATGFIGSHLAESLLNEGHEVLCPVRDPRKHEYLNSSRAKIIALDRLEGEIRSNNKFDYFFHLAGATRALNYEGYWSANVELTNYLLDLISKSFDLQRFKRFVFVSSQAVSGPAPDHNSCISEYDVPRPVSLYGRSKLEAEQVVKQYGDVIPYVIIRPSTVFGPRDTDVLELFKSCKYRITLCLTGRQRQVSVVFVEDLVTGIKRAAFLSKSVNETYFITNPEPVVWRQFVADIAELMGVHTIILPIPGVILKSLGFFADIIGNFLGKPFLFRSEKIAEIDQWYWICSSQKAYHDLGWAPQNSLKENLKKTLDWYNNEGWI
ncbi:MAG: NAD(P)-dependent oxidoreductase [Deltaproteobacteria bacterium]|nr:NAD(P)-dependent oxidoreductase [Deltaproteobacteria bacterium]